MFCFHYYNRYQTQECKDGCHQEVIVNACNISLFTDVGQDHILTLLCCCRDVAAGMLLCKVAYFACNIFKLLATCLNSRSKHL